MNKMEEITYFGYQSILRHEKTAKVEQVFKSVAKKYDLMNDLMSFGTHRCWKNFAVMLCHLRQGQRILDLAGGTGDLTRQISPLIGDNGEIILVDINAAMLSIGQNRLLDQGIFKNVKLIQANAEDLPFSDNFFDRIIIGFGLRNITDKMKALRSIYRALKPGGFITILEFSKPASTLLKTLYDVYSFKVLPWLGKMVANDQASYRYLVESIRVYPDQKTLLVYMTKAGFENCDYHNLSGGIVSVHKGYKF
ncbi:bifunctional demethylmenaquinone methyltransferase/2-methoxy-6-polyprenyl-1,4-benzoquinol methylase UbiE [Coxiella endosymbiont of Amblyomma nuttalli]|uniref:bifunctional demethylmenaquinone methyltransferase/2-methoxy-6-polyprenyl-1,4-benzoquinol methylase UbiE n=1 Tax=Coxiella endosymbiont of Amblyomma nuttalli TaxID=2749996 RepID=UPI001BA5F448|nr:bifunctional demethylmenaquinone methyltransferase/2-methoxy-6-polyprenyl-1,4-benzoquinol methylase UbiE [Coxiella endosymbiont of Amblyomma nuttalli]QTS83604.1 Ubiquinone/menaquinone biosynthesis C-methyltransferase UbiE [Coxiella endosymbiont of Amblyomma nuttalli]